MTPAVAPIAFKNVLFLTDFSKSSEMALPHAIAMAAACEGKVYIGHVIAPQFYDLVPPGFVPEVLKQSTAYAQRRMERLVKETDFGSVPHECLLEQGELWETLRRLANQYAIDLIAVGTGGRRGLHELLMGSIAEEILRLAHCPVLTVGPESRDVPANKPRCILLANDFSENCRRAVLYGDVLARKFEVRLVCLHVASEAPEDPEITARLEQFLLQKLENSFEVTSFAKGQVEFRVEFGEPADSILKAASKNDVDLIVMGVRGARSVKRATCHLGRNTYEVVLDARCPVLVVPG